ncbi:hypothetical protein A9Q87_12615 [Flavobacteriales bacterium 34_180_T64]|nr:hypothetical protein A9Q87_12615 [Flavobacteriales bacterium 34_180_T64]
MKNIILLLGFIFIGITVQAQHKISAEVQDHIKTRIDKGLNVGIVVALINGDDVEFFSYGKTALENGSNVDEFSVFEIGSITKTFTTIMIADEILKGRMSLSDPISKYLPEHVKVPSRNGREITIKDVATHSSSIPRMPSNFAPSNPNNPFADYTIDMAYEYISGLELTRDIGERFEYSNIAMGILGHLLELQYGKTYEEIMVDRIANVYDMNNTRVVFTDDMKKHLAYGHANGNQVENWDLPALAGAGAIRSTATDMVKYVKANMGVTKGPLYEAMQLSHKKAYSNEEQDFSIGLGWHYALDDDKVVWHNGGTGGYISFAGFLEGTTTGVVVLTNSQRNINDIGFKILDDTFELKMPKMSIANAMEAEIETNGLEAGLALYKKTKTENNEAYNFNEGELNQLGYALLAKENMDAALAIFKLNIEMYPKAFNPYDSLGEAYLTKGDTALAVTNYRKSLEFNAVNENAIQVLKTMGEDTSAFEKAYEVSETVLDTYVGKYQLSPDFFITVTKEGSKLLIQATGQPQFEVFPSAEHEFYLKVVTASITFNPATENDGIESLILHQGGQDMPGIKVE